MKMPAIPMSQARVIARKVHDWYERRAAPVIIEIPSHAERIGYSLGRKTRNVLAAIRS